MQRQMQGSNTMARIDKIAKIKLRRKNCRKNCKEKIAKKNCKELQRKNCKDIIIAKINNTLDQDK